MQFFTMVKSFIMLHCVTQLCNNLHCVMLHYVTQYCSFEGKFYHKCNAFIRVQAEQFSHKSSLNLGKFEAIEGVSAYR